MFPTNTTTLILTLILNSFEIIKIISISTFMNNSKRNNHKKSIVKILKIKEIKVLKAILIMDNSQSQNSEEFKIGMEI
jgi:hypothetical protein